MACGENKRIMNILGDIESHIEDEPQRALSALQDIKGSIGDSDNLKAKYALLYSIALDKNYIDLKADTIIAPAVEYYSRRGTNNDKLLTYYYLGRIYQNTGDFNKAAVEFSKAEALASDSDNNLIKGRLYMAIATIYNSTRNSEKEIDYVQKGYEAFKLAGSEHNCKLSVSRLAMAYSNLRQWEKSDSLFNLGLSLCCNDSILMPLFLSSYARVKVLKPDREPDAAIEFLSRICNDYAKPLATRDLYAYAYALALKGDTAGCDSILKSLNGKKHKEREYWMYLINDYRENYKDAIYFLTQSSLRQEEEIQKYLTNSVDSTVKEYYKQKEFLNEVEYRYKILMLIALILGIVAISSVSIIFLLNKNRKKQKEIESYLKMAEAASLQLDKYEEKVTSQGVKIKSMQKMYAQMYKKQFATISELCRSYLLKQDKKNVKDFIYRKVENIVIGISSDDKLHFQLERQINKELNNILLHLKEDIPTLSKEDIRFVCYCIIGFDANLISIILNLSASNVYTKKSRLRSKINMLDSPYKEQYLDLI